jgi:hypothetical protein
LIFCIFWPGIVIQYSKEEEEEEAEGGLSYFVGVTWNP